jgi:hypothetical protein
MHEVTRIVDQLKRAYDGDAWHGPSVRGVLEQVDAQMASARPWGALLLGQRAEEHLLIDRRV